MSRRIMIALLASCALVIFILVLIAALQPTPPAPFVPPGYVPPNAPPPSPR